MNRRSVNMNKANKSREMKKKHTPIRLPENIFDVPTQSRKAVKTRAIQLKRKYNNLYEHSDGKIRQIDEHHNEQYSLEEDADNCNFFCHCNEDSAAPCECNRFSRCFCKTCLDHQTKILLTDTVIYDVACSLWYGILDGKLHFKTSGEFCEATENHKKMMLYEDEAYESAVYYLKRIGLSDDRIHRLLSIN